MIVEIRTTLRKIVIAQQYRGKLGDRCNCQTHRIINHRIYSHMYIFDSKIASVCRGIYNNAGLEYAAATCAKIEAIFSFSSCFPFSQCLDLYTRDNTCFQRATPFSIGFGRHSSFGPTLTSKRDFAHPEAKSRQAIVIELCNAIAKLI